MKPFNTTSTQTLAGIPATRTVRKAYLYWGASGNTADTTVTLNGNSVSASRTFTRTFNNGTAFNYFGGFADVTTMVWNRRREPRLHGPVPGADQLIPMHRIEAISVPVHPSRDSGQRVNARTAVLTA